MTSKPSYCSFGTKRGLKKPPQAESQKKEPAVRPLRVCGTNQAFKSGSICPSSDLILCSVSHATVLLSMSLNPCTSKEQSKSSKTAKATLQFSFGKGCLDNPGGCGPLASSKTHISPEAVHFFLYHQVKGLQLRLD